ncbi:MAG: putative selenate ABC transporter substrate-binding protein [Ornithinimicrobium sp.]
MKSTRPNTAVGRRTILMASSGVLILAACGSDDSESADESTDEEAEEGGGGESAGPLTISAIPDQDPELLNRLYPDVAARFAEATGLEVEYKPVTDYTAVVRAFEVGDVYIAWMGGLTGVQAASRVDGAQAFAQRDIDPEFHSLFIANTSAGIEPFDDVDGLQALADKTLTFGSETSTSGRLMPQYFMEEGGFDQADLNGSPGFSGSHDATIEAVASGSFEVGALNEQVWKATVEAGEVDVSDVVVLFRTPAYYDYHWLARPDVDEVFGEGTTQEISDMLLSLDPANEDDAAILELFGAESFIETENSNYDQIKQVAQEQGLLA